jgi:ADP-ribose pyrophosphatase YjhB (NUDIX family)
MSFADSYLGKLRQKIGSALIQVPGGRIILEQADGSILLQKRTDFEQWGLPAGSPEVGETVSESIMREVLEETGLTVTTLDCFGFSSNPQFEIVTYPNGDQIHCYSLLFYATQWSGDLIDSNEETLELGFFAPAKLPDMLLNHRHTIGLYLAFKQSGQFQLD